MRKKKRLDYGLPLPQSLEIQKKSLKNNLGTVIKMEYATLTEE